MQKPKVPQTRARGTPDMQKQRETMQGKTGTKSYRLVGFQALTET